LVLLAPIVSWEARLSALRCHDSDVVDPSRKAELVRELVLS
jgi:hypothetical protein